MNRILLTVGLPAMLMIAACGQRAPFEETTQIAQERQAEILVAEQAESLSSSEFAHSKPQPSARSAESEALRSYLRRVQSSQLALGLLRQDGGGADTPFNETMLAQNFERTAFYNEYGGAGPVALRRWQSPIRVKALFGAQVSDQMRRQDRQDVSRFVGRLSRITGHPMSLSGPPNFLVLFAGEDDRVALLERVVEEFPQFSGADLSAFRNLGKDTYCLVAAYGSARQPGSYSAAIALVRDENPDLLRLSCIHEEIAQGLGLANDSPRARPSIFNDDDEFALLTSHDEALLSMLYDPRLTAGMQLDTARPVIRKIAREKTTSGQLGL